MDIRDIFRAGGGVAKVAREIGRDHSTLLGWKKVPPEHIEAVARATGLSAAEVRPDLAKLFARPVAAPAQAKAEAAA